jgi:hypothetical protein
MAKPQAPNGHNDENLRGTFVFVLLLAAIMAAVWLTVFIVFLSRY